MLHRRKRMAVLMAGVLAALIAVPAYGDSKKPIKSINLTIKAEIVPGTDYGDEVIEIEASGSKFSVDGYEVVNNDNEWREDTVPRIEITLTADDDYFFKTLPKEDVKLNGGARLISNRRQDGNETLLMEVELQALNTSLRDLEDVTLTEEGVATWKAIPAAGSYEVRIYKDGKASGSVMTVTTNSCNSREKMQKGNISYTAKVRPVSKFDAGEKGDWMESPSVYITDEKAAQFRDNPGGGSGTWIQAPENGRWWYSNADGTYFMNGWQQIEGKWYFFDAEGYMVTGWVQWDGKEYYCSENGDMLTDCMTPDAYWVGEDGAKISQ